MSHLKSLYLKNFVLIKEALVEFHEGFHAISGETGSGKTMIIQALALILGEKADYSVIRKGEEKAFIQAEFTLESLSCLEDFFKDLEIEKSFKTLKISREISKNKNKAWINSKPANLADLKKIAPYLADIIHSHSQLLLQDPSYQKNILDSFGLLQPCVQEHASFYLQQQKLSLEKTKLLELQKEGVIYAKLWEDILHEIAALPTTSEDQEKKLFEKYLLLNDQQEQMERGKKLLHELSDSPQSILDKLSKLQKDLTKIASDPQLHSIELLASEAQEHLSTISFKLSSYLDGMEASCTCLETMEKQLSQIKAIKKKYGPSFSDVLSYKISLKQKLQDFTDLEERLEKVDKELAAISKQREIVAKKLSAQRAQAAQTLAASIESYLPFLNLSKAHFFIEVSQTLPANDGEDIVNFLFQTEGSLEKRSLSLHASSGELARIFFILKLLLQHHEPKKILIFDEIDANIGGMTAGKLGELLKQLGQHQQVLAITHFAQVALHADHHLHIEKMSYPHEVSSLITLLDEGSKKKELYRMVGGISLTQLSMD